MNFRIQKNKRKRIKETQKGINTSRKTQNKKTIKGDENQE